MFRGVITGDKASLDNAQEEGYYLVCQTGNDPVANSGPYDHGVLEVHRMPSGAYLFQKVFNIRGRILSRYKVSRATDWDKWYDVNNKVAINK